MSPDAPVTETLSKIPIVPKEVFRRESERFLSRRATPFNSQPFRTSGSTGTPIRGVISLRDLRQRYLAIWRWFAPLGMSPAKRWARFIGRDITDGPQDGVSRWDFVNNHLFLSVYHLGEQTVEQYYEVLYGYRPEILEGYPSAVAALAQLMVECGYPRLDIPAVFVTAETLSDRQAEVIREAFGVRPFNYYGSSEFAPVLAQADDGNLHLLPETGLIEVLDPSGCPVEPGETGRLVVTSFQSSFMPLIRYDIGDLASVVSGGPSDLAVSQIIGRIDDTIVSPDGRYISRLSTALKKLPTYVRLAQCRVNGRRVRVLYVSELPIRPCDAAPFLSSMRAKLGPVKIELSRVRDIPPGPRGKRLTVVREGDDE